jgi:serine/threonine protein kinase
LNGGQVIKIVVGRKSDEVEKEYLLMLQYHKWEAITSLVFPVVEGSYRCGVMRGVRYAGYILDQEGQQIPLPVTNDLKKELVVSLCGLHSHSVIHGDPRIENVLILEGVVRWIDFCLCETVTTKISRRRDVEILYKSLGGLVGAASEEIEAYANGPTVEKLLCVLFK